VRSDLIKTLRPAIVGWAAHDDPFGFETGPIRCADGIERFQSGTPNVPALAAARAGYEIVAKVGVPVIRARSLELTRRLMDAFERRGWRLNMPVVDRQRGGSVIVDVPNGQQVADELIRRQVIVDYRPNAGIRIAPHFYNSEADIDKAVAVMDAVIDETVRVP
jgi:kynureninase